jgi:hypothetical protein
LSPISLRHSESDGREERGEKEIFVRRDFLLQITALFVSLVHTNDREIDAEDIVTKQSFRREKNASRDFSTRISLSDTQCASGL